MIHLARIREALQQPGAARYLNPERPDGGAAVALVFAGAADDLRLCFIRRAARAGDHWSGQMAFPGGRAEEQDPTRRAIAERETREEVGLELVEAEFLGPLPELWIRHSGIVTREVLSPFAYYAGAGLPALRISDEVAKAYWVPMAELWNPENLTRIEYERDGRRLRLPGIRHDGQVIWGLTYMMLESLGELVGTPLPKRPR